MIIISCMTDVYAGVALSTEKIESDIMLLPPRVPENQPLVSIHLICYSYFFYGTMQAVGAFYLYFLYMSERGPLGVVASPIPIDDDGKLQFPVGYLPHQLIRAWNWGSNKGNLGEDERKASSVASSVFFVALIVAQWGHLVSVRRKSPYFSDSILDLRKQGGSLSSRFIAELQQSLPLPSILAAIILSATTANIFNEIPFLQKYCGTGSVPARYWGIAIGFSICWFFVGEIRKWVIILYPKSCISKSLNW